MKKKGFIRIILLLLLVFSLINTTVYISAKDKEDKVKKDKDDKVKKDKDDKDKDKEDKDKDKEDFMSDYASYIVKSEVIYSEKNQIIKNNNFGINQISTIDKITSLSKILEELLGETDEIKKAIKINPPGKSPESIKTKYYSTKKRLNLVAQDSIKILNDLNEKDKDLITQQRDNIQKSNKKINKLLLSIENDLNKNRKNEDIFNKMKLMEKEIQILYRQYRAIEWIILTY